MIRKFLHSLLLRHHFWRHANFDELSQIYISSFFRSIAITLVGVFIPVFLYDLDYTFVQIFWFYISYFSFRAILHIPVAYVLARIGPKHTIILSFAFQIISSLSLMTLPEYQWPLWLIALLWSAANNLFFTAYHVDFSKVKHKDHSGKEMGFANILQHLGGAIGPIGGGIIATVFGPQYIFMAMTLMLIIGLVPLLSSAEPIKTKQHISFARLPFRKVARDALSYSGLTISHQFTVVVWPLYLALYALGANVYLELGALQSIGFFVSIVSAYAIGKIVDAKRGRSLLRASVVADSFIQLCRPFVASLPFALFVNTVGETSATGLRISFQKGMYDAADDLPGNRIVYISYLEAVASIVKALAWVLLLIIGIHFTFLTAFIAAFIIAALANGLLFLENFKGLD